MGVAMLAHIVIAATALIVSRLTLFLGFGLGTILMPAFSLFFPVPAAFAAIGSAWLLGQLTDMPALVRYDLLGGVREIQPVKLTIGLIIVVFAVLELSPRFATLSFAPRFLVLGGLVSGFFGDLSGNQGALRSAFLLKAGFDKEAFVATGVVAAVVVDMVRLSVYGLSFDATNFSAIGGGSLQQSFVPASRLRATIMASLDCLRGWTGRRADSTAPGGLDAIRPRCIMARRFSAAMQVGERLR
jgi:hypothetical protein